MSSTPIIITPPPPPPPPPPVEKIATDPASMYAYGWDTGWIAGYKQGADDNALIPAVKRWWQSKTLWFSKGLVAVGMWLEWLHLSQPVVRDALGDYGAPAIIAVGLATFVLRVTTKQGVGK